MRGIMLGLNFKGSWRQYQKQVLDRFQDYQADGHVHLVAAPGSGKTTIGIELMLDLAIQPLSWFRLSPFVNNGWTGFKQPF